MVETIKIECDKCGADLTHSEGMPSYSLKLTSRSLPNISKYECAVFVSPEIESGKDFCSIKCLKGWIDDRT